MSGRRTWLLTLSVLSCITLVSGQSASYYDTTWTNYFRLNSGDWTAGDATISVPLPDKKPWDDPENSRTGCVLKQNTRYIEKYH